MTAKEDKEKEKTPQGKSKQVYISACKHLLYCNGSSSCSWSCTWCGGCLNPMHCYLALDYFLQSSWRCLLITF